MAVEDKEELEVVKETVLEKAKKMAGVTEPLGFFDPVGFCSEEGLTEGKLCFYREVEVKHGRVAMLASLGFLVGEQFHPLFGGDIGFDPLGLKPTDPKELKEMQTKELNNGRLAMIAAAGMIAQELASGQKLF